MIRRSGGCSGGRCRQQSGTITGISRFIKKTQGKAIVSVAVEPEDSPVISKAGRSGAQTRPASDTGIGAGFIPDILI